MATHDYKLFTIAIATGTRLKSELINLHKGTPANYIAKYISKSVDGRGLAQEISKETGRSLRDNAENVTWASLHRVQQFRFFGHGSQGVPRTALAGRSGCKSAG